MQSRFGSIVLHLLRILLGLTFLFSGYVKLYPIEPFEFNFVDQGFANWYIAPFMARFIIGFEFLLGLFLVLNFSLKRFTLKATIALLVFFTLYLVFGIIKDGNTGNCGCFGTYLKMTPLESIVKNIAMLAVAFILYRYHRDFSWPYAKLVGGLCIAFALTMPFILNPLDLFLSGNYAEEKTGYKLELDFLYHDKDNKPPAVELRQGKQVLAFFSLTCPHCKVAAFKLHILKKQHPELPVHMILMGPREAINPFFEETKSGDLPYTLFNKEEMYKIIGPQVPTIFLLENSVVRKKMFTVKEDDPAFDLFLQ